MFRSGGVRRLSKAIEQAQGSQALQAWIPIAPCVGNASPLTPVASQTPYLQGLKLAAANRQHAEEEFVSPTSQISCLHTALAAGPSLSHFLRVGAESGSTLATQQCVAPVPAGTSPVAGREGGAASAMESTDKVYLETYGCQMNVSDSEVLLSVLSSNGFAQTDTLDDASVVLLNTCAIRENAEAKIWQRLGYFKNMKRARRRGEGPVVGVLGCMAERLKHRLLESDKLVDIVAGPDAYRDLPSLIAAVRGSLAVGKRESAMNVQLSLEETYADIVPLRPAGATSAFLSIMRGCNNMCAFCIVPFTRGRERSRPLASILDEVRLLSGSGVREVMLLGQNVNSYADFSDRDASSSGATAHHAHPGGVYARGFRSVYKPRRDGAAQFAELLDRVADIDPEMRIRFTSPHPKDFSDDVLQVIRSRDNICNQLHMPAQHGSSGVLERMRRGYTREAYDQLLLHVRNTIPNVAISTDIITGFCGETEEEHAATVDLMRRSAFDQAFMFAYSQRDKTHAARHLQDDVAPDVKARRLQEVIAAFRHQLAHSMRQEEGRRHLVLVEGPARHRQGQESNRLTGRTDTMKRVVFPDLPVPASYLLNSNGAGFQPSPAVVLRPGDYVAVQVEHAGTQTIYARPLARTTLNEFVGVHGSAAPAEKLDIFDTLAHVDREGSYGMVANA